MFRNRTSQKPNDELYATFKQTFPEVGQPATSSAATSQSTASLTDALKDPALNPTLDPSKQFGDHEGSKDHEITPRGSVEQFRFTPSFLDPNSFSFASFANQPPGYYTPTPGGGMNTVYHNQAGDLHTPGMTFHLGTPLSMNMSDGSIPAGQTFSYMHGFHPQMFHTQPYQTSTLFPQQQQQQQQQSFAPSMLVHHDSGYEAMEGSPEDDSNLSPEMHRGSLASLPAQGFERSMPAPPVPSAEKFRYHATLNAPTAMIRDADEIPVTYLNKGQAYTMTIFDTVPLPPSITPTKYRTVIRISFEDEQQRQKPAACWQLWKEGRGLAEAHQRGGKLQAVEYVDAHPGGGEEDVRRTRVELESASFDSFSVTWTPALNPSNSAECSVTVRFNFLSTDFSHSKGVKGIPVRLCAKTQMIVNGTPGTTLPTEAEVCYCKVKLFRDHGAERKLSNDVAHVKKTIDKLKQQIAQVESGMKDFGKRKRSGSTTGRASGDRPGKVPKHKRTWSVSSQSSTGRPAVEEDLHQKLATVQDMFTSTRPVSVLYLKGLEQDDPDLFPVSLAGKHGETITLGSDRRDLRKDQRPNETSPASSGHVSPTQSSRSAPTKGQSADRHDNLPFDQLERSRPQWSSTTHQPSADLSSSKPEISSHAVKVQKSGESQEADWIQALDVDLSYKPPPERLVKPVACFYVLIKLFGTTPEDDYYRAVYLLQRTVNDLVNSIAAKCGVVASRVQRTLRINAKGLKIVVDDEVVRELPEGQDMAVEFNEIDTDKTVKEEKDQFTVDTTTSNITDDPAALTPLEMKLIY